MEDRTVEIVIEWECGELEKFTVSEDVADMIKSVIENN